MMTTRRCTCPARRRAYVGAVAPLLAIGVLLLVSPRATRRPERRSLPPINSKSAPVRYTITELGSPPEGFDRAGAMAINNRGQVLCTATTSGGLSRVFLWENGRFTDLGSPKEVNTLAVALNNRGEAVGYVRVSERPNQKRRLVIFRGGKMVETGVLAVAHGMDDMCRVVGAVGGYPGHAFLYDGGKMIDLGTLGGRSSTAWRINNRGQIVGTAALKSGATHAFLYSDGKMQDLGTLDGRHSEGLAINEKGWVVGVSVFGNNGRVAFLYRDGKMEGMENYPGTWPYPAAMNNAGVVVGYAMGGEYKMMGAMIWIDRYIYRLQDLIPPDSGWTLDRPTGINDRGEITVAGRLAGHQGVQYCILRPVKEAPDASTPREML